MVLFFVVSYAEKHKNQTVNEARFWFDNLRKDPFKAWHKEEADWEFFFDSAPPPHTDDSNLIRLYRMSLTAMRMGLYRKRNKMPSAFCSVPCKGHFNAFWCWDTPFQTL